MNFGVPAVLHLDDLAAIEHAVELCARAGRLVGEVTADQRVSGSADRRSGGSASAVAAQGSPFVRRLGCRERTRHTNGGASQRIAANGVSMSGRDRPVGAVLHFERSWRARSASLGSKDPRRRCLRTPAGAPKTTAKRERITCTGGATCRPAVLISLSYRIPLPSADSASSVANSAVVLRMSRVGLTSTRSSATRRRESATSSITMCASR